MPFNIDRFKANIEESGYIKTNSFGILISPPAILQNSQILNGGFSNPVNNVTNDLLFRVSELSTPATALNVADINRYGVGPTQKFPLNSVFNNLTLGILCDQYGDIWRFWYNWLNSQKWRLRVRVRLARAWRSSRRPTEKSSQNVVSTL